MSTKIILILSLCAFALHLSLASSKGEFKIATRGKKNKNNESYFLAFVRFEQGTNCSREDTKYCQWYALGEKELAITNGHEVKFKFNTTDNRLPPESNMTQVYVSGVITALEMPPDTDHEGLYISSGMIVNYLPERNGMCDNVENIYL